MLKFQPPACCKSGYYTLDACGCCYVCALADQDVCGGPWDVGGEFFINMLWRQMPKPDIDLKARALLDWHVTKKLKIKMIF